MIDLIFERMGELFLKILNMSLNAGWLVLAVLLLRIILKKAPKWISCLLWGMVALRLILPFSLKSIFSLLPKADPIPSNIEMMREPAIDSGIGILNDAINPIISGSFTPEPMASANPLQVLMPLWSLIWAIGIMGMLLYGLISCLRLRKICKANILYKENVYFCDFIDSPFIFGLLKPKIYLPSDMDSAHIGSVLAHERAHLKRGDHWWKPIGFLLLSIYWFQPLLWLSYYLLCRDIEGACDEKVIRTMDESAKKEYSEALLSCSLHRTKITACPLAFGEVGVKARIKSVLSYKKPALWILIAALLLTIAVGLCFLTDPLQKDPEEGLTLERVVELSKKGESLTLADFEEFEFVETGSGLYIRCYEIDEMFSLRIGSIEIDAPPIYFYLYAKDGTEEQIDIRYEDVESFIKDHKNNPVVEGVSAGWQCCPVGYLDFEEFDSLTFPVASILSPRGEIPVVEFKEYEDFNQFYQSSSDLLLIDHSYHDVISFSKAAEAYDKVFFENSTLYMIYMTAPTTAHRFTVEQLYVSKNKLSIELVEQEPEAGDTAMEGWLICIGVPKDQVKNVESVAAHLGSNESLAQSDERIGYYVYRASEDVVKPSLSLYANGKFTFTFSALSSYLGIGSYRWEDDCLSLYTDDGLYSYYFDVRDGALFFDAESSSDQLWLSDLPDGAKFN